MGVMGALCWKWTGQTGRARPPAQPGSGPTAGQSRALLWRRSLGQAGGGRWGRQLLSGRIFVAAQPTASSMETARPLSHRAPLAVHCSLPTDWPERRVCVYKLRVQGSATQRGRFQARMCADGLRGCLQIAHHQPSAPAPVHISHPTTSFTLPLLCPSLLSAYFQVHPPGSRLSTWPPRALVDLGWTAA